VEVPRFGEGYMQYELVKRGTEMWRKLLPLVAVFALYGASYLPYRSLTTWFREKEEDPSIVYLPRTAAMKQAKFGLEGVLSDVLWLRSIGYIHAQFDTPRPGRYRQLPAIYDAITDLDPYFLDAYRTGAIFLTLFLRDADGAITLLRKGLTIPEFQDRWEFYYDLGTIYYVEKKDRNKAEESFRKAAEDLNAPPIVPWLATRLKGMIKKEEDISIAISIWRRRLESKDELVRRIAKQEVNRLTRELDMRNLQQAVDLFRQLEGRWPSDLQELLKPGILAKLPQEQARRFFERIKKRPPKDNAELLSFLQSRTMVEKLPEEPTGGRYLIDPKTGKISYEEKPQAQEKTATNTGRADK
jgi:tetratricopeptide (TPR) repeat protein